MLKGSTRASYPAVQGSIFGFTNIFILDVAEIYQWRWVESEQRLYNIDRIYLVVAIQAGFKTVGLG